MKFHNEKVGDWTIRLSKTKSGVILNKKLNISTYFKFNEDNELAVTNFKKLPPSIIKRILSFQNLFVEDKIAYNMEQFNHLRKVKSAMEDNNYLYIEIDYSKKGSIYITGEKDFDMIKIRISNHFEKYVRHKWERQISIAPDDLTIEQALKIIKDGPKSVKRAMHRKKK